MYNPLIKPTIRWGIERDNAMSGCNTSEMFLLLYKDHFQNQMVLDTGGTLYPSIDAALEACWSYYKDHSETVPFALFAVNTVTGRTRHIYDANELESEAYSLWKQSEDYERYQEEQEIDRQIDEYREFARGGVL